jgi:hypothetical protein
MCVCVCNIHTFNKHNVHTLNYINVNVITTKCFGPVVGPSSGCAIGILSDYNIGCVGGVW